jgi:hypothetical protein
MESSAIRARARSVARVILVWLGCAAMASIAWGQSRPYTPKNGVLSWKAVLLGGGFRVTSAIPMHGNFSAYRHLEIVRCASLIGSDVPPAVLRQITRTLATSFARGRRFADVVVVDSFDPDAARARAAVPAQPGLADADSLEAPMRTGADLLALDRQRAAEAEAPPAAVADTLVVGSQVIDYARGNRWLQLLLLDLGNAVLTLRFSYYDKTTGEELGRSVISSDTSSRIIPSTFSSRTALAGVAEGLVDQVTRRKLGAER